MRFSNTSPLGRAQVNSYQIIIKISRALKGGHGRLCALPDMGDGPSAIFRAQRY
jgi:hypothetical protein